MRPATSAAALCSPETAPPINLAKGHPSPQLLPLAELCHAFDAAARRPDAHVTMMQYGMSQGDARLRQQIAQWVRTRAQRPTANLSPDDILITNGSSAALALVCQLFSKPEDTVFVDSPGYFLAYYSFKDCNLNIVQVPTDQHGLDVDVIEKRLNNGERPALVYTVPLASNPTGVYMSEARKQKLVKLSRQYGFKIASDEVYQFLTFDSKLPTSLYEYDHPDSPTVFAINSFSKLLGPGLRVGWLTTNRLHLQRIVECGPIRSGGGFNPFTSAVISEMIESTVMQKQVDALRTHYQANSSTLCAAIETYIRPALRESEILHYHRPQGGYFCFITLPKRINSEKLLKLAKERYGVLFLAGHHCSSDGNGFQNCIRLCFAFLSEEEIPEGVRRIGEAIRNYDDDAQ